MDGLAGRRRHSAILLTYYLMDFTAKGRVQGGPRTASQGDAGRCDELIVDTCVLDLATLGRAWSAMYDIKHEFGLPVGGGVHNAVAVWKGLKTKMGPQAPNRAWPPCAPRPSPWAPISFYTARSKMLPTCSPPWPWSTLRSANSSWNEVAVPTKITHGSASASAYPPT